MPRFFAGAPHDKEAQVESLVAEVFRQGGWRVLEQPGADHGKPDLIAEHAGKKYVVEIKRSSEGRKDRLIPLVSQAILQAQEAAHRLPGHAVAVAIVVANYVPESVAEQVKQFARRHAPDIAVGVMDFEGLRAFEGHGLERLNSERPRARKVVSPGHRAASPQLFSDLNQWMLKVLLAPSIPEHYLSAPRGRYQGASQLAEAADVSVMSAFRFIEQFSKAGFLEEEHYGLRVVRIEELMNRWRGANQGSVSEVGVRWVLRGKKNALWDAVRSYVWSEEKQHNKHRNSQDQRSHVHRPRACLALFAAAEALGLGFVHGVQPHLYLERIEAKILEKLGFSASSVDVDPDVHIRVPRNDESVFRAVVLNNGVPACDILQVWLDVAQHPSRGKEQADMIWRKILAPVLLPKEKH
jgi:Restriction endonuclease